MSGEISSTEGANVITVCGHRTLGELIHAGANFRGNDTLLCFETAEGTIYEHSWTDVAERMEDARRRLAALGVAPGDVVVLCLRNCPAFHILWWAISSLGAAMLPAEPSSGAILLRRLVDATKARVLITTPAHVTNAKDTTSGPAACRILVVQDELLSDPRSSVEGWGNDRDPHPPAPNSHLDTAALLQTSGSTGVPKLVELTHANYIFAGESTARNYGLTGDDRAFICLPLFHSGAQFFSTMASVVTFGSIGYVPQFSASGYMESIVATQSTWGVLFGPPMRMIIRRWR
ncbi:MAG: AMP-binding protein, partial [Hyphomicrobium sp.]|nr:AMP-binding protein [Hyphomicrobium sp.]